MDPQDILTGDSASADSPPRGVFAGLSTVDVIYFVDALPQRNVKIAAAGQQIAAGGPATNAAITFAFLGGQARSVTAVGRHPLAAVIRHDLDRFGVSLCDMASEHREAPPLSSIFVFRETGERSVVSANDRAFPPLQHRIDPSWFEKAAVTLVDGHYMPLCEAVASHARSRGIPVVLDAGSWKPGMAELLPSVDIAICSDDFRPPGSQSEADVFTFLSEHGVAHTAITRGERPICYVQDGTSGEISVEKIKAVDTLGAGDVFHGAFCYWVCHRKHSFRESLEFAARVATLSCLYPGTRLWMEAFPGISAIEQSLSTSR